MNQIVSSAVNESRSGARVRVFVDYWNSQLTLNELEAKEQGLEDYRFKVAWGGLGPWLAKKACQTVGIDPGSYSFEGVIIYASYNPQTPESRGFRKWATTWLNRQAGIRVICLERKPRRPLECPSCNRKIEFCPHEDCGKKIVATIEKGVDTFIATDMIRLAWENAYDLAVLASSDSDLVPAVEFLNLKARKIVQAGFPPRGVALATACWASFDVYRDRQEFRRQSN